MIAREHRSGKTRPDVVKRAVFAAHRHDTAVATAEAAAHDALDRHLTRTPVGSRDFCRRREHAFGAAGIDHHRRLVVPRGKLSIQRCDHAAGFAEASIFGRELSRRETPEESGEELGGAAP